MLRGVRPTDPILLVTSEIPVERARRLLRADFPDLQIIVLEDDLSDLPALAEFVERPAVVLASHGVTAPQAVFDSLSAAAASNVETLAASPGDLPDLPDLRPRRVRGGEQSHFLSTLDRRRRRRDQRRS